MRVKILEKKPGELKLEIEGEGHTFCNLLEDVLLEDETVEIAGYEISHPLTSNPIIHIRMKGRRRPETALKEAVEKILRREKELRMEFKRAMEEWRKTAKKKKQS